MFQVNPLLGKQKNQALFSLKDKSGKLICHMLQFLFGALRVNYIPVERIEYYQTCPAASSSSQTGETTGTTVCITSDISPVSVGKKT